ncbi:MAG: recombinase family protein [Pseudonocardia sp.]|nr:recombinase family protein [Pseudonocardia sp.]
MPCSAHRVRTSPPCGRRTAAEVVRRIFRQFLAGGGVRGIAAGLNGEGIACPSTRRPDQNRHRLADGWQGSTVHAILENPRYTGYAVFGRWAKVERLADPDDVAAGHAVRFERAAPDRIVRSRQPAHPAIVTVADFTHVQVERRSRSSQGMREWPRCRGPARRR